MERSQATTADLRTHNFTATVIHRQFKLREQSQTLFRRRLLMSADRLHSGCPGVYLARFWDSGTEKHVYKSLQRQTAKHAQLTQHHLQNLADFHRNHPTDATHAPLACNTSIQSKQSRQNSRTAIAEHGNISSNRCRINRTVT